MDDNTEQVTKIGNEIKRIRQWANNERDTSEPDFYMQGFIDACEKMLEFIEDSLEKG